MVLFSFYGSFEGPIILFEMYKIHIRAAKYKFHSISFYIHTSTSLQKQITLLLEGIGLAGTKFFSNFILYLNLSLCHFMVEFE